MSSRARSAAGKNGPSNKKRKKKPSPTTEQTSILSLPYDLLLNCLARVSRLYYPTLSLEGLPNFGSYLIVDVGGKMMVLWDESVYQSARREVKVIWCAEISIERWRDGDEIWGKVEWFEAVLPVHKFCRLWYADALSAIV